MKLVTVMPFLVAALGCRSPGDPDPPVAGESGSDDTDQSDVLADTGDMDTGDTDEPADPFECESTGSKLERELDPGVSDDDIVALTDGSRQFALDLFHRLAEDTDGNLIFSPHSVSIALAMAYAGAEGDTELQMQDVLHLALPEPDVHAAFNGLDLELASRSEVSEGGYEDAQGFELSIANKIWGQQGYPFEQDYLDLLAVHYDSDMCLIDFIADADAARLGINDWVEAQTDGRIEDLLPEGSLGEATRFVLTNAIYFRASWHAPFEEADTVDATFHLADGTTTQTPFMNSRVSAAYAVGDGWSVIALPYVDGLLDMVLIVPDDGRYESVESTVDNVFLEEATAAMSTHRVTLSMPRFAFSWEAPLDDPLKDLGMTDAYTPGTADFTGISPDETLHVSGAYHKAFVDVNEAGTEASAATAIAGSAGSSPPSATLDIDRPFLFLVRDRPTGAVLFLGRVLDPGAQTE